MRKLINRFAVGLALAVVAGCEDPLNVPNENQPSSDDVLSNAFDVEQIIGGTYRAIHATYIHANDNIDNQLKVMALESFASVANYGMNLRVAIPRSLVSNERGNAVQAGNYRDFQQLQVQARSTATYIAAFDALQSAATAPIMQGSAGRSNASRAFAFFSLGLAQGMTAMVYDSAATVLPTTPRQGPGSIGELVAYDSVMRHALAMMDSAINIANLAASVTDDANFTIPQAWVRTSAGSMSRTQFIQLVRSYKARLRAGVARDATQRAAVDWAAVIADAQNGLPGGLVLLLQSDQGWTNAWITSQLRYQGWHNMSNHFIGMADTSGAYLTWLNTPNASKAAFLIRTPDLRFPAGATRAAQQAVSFYPSAPPAGSRLYFRNRPTGEDSPVPAYGESFYDHIRYYALFLSPTVTGSWHAIARPELDMLMAEGYLRTGQAALAIPLINITRLTSGLPAIPAGATVVPAGPGGSACVPQVPSGPAAGPYTTSCATLFEAMKYEKRMETAQTGYGQWYFDSRGWGDLPEGTAIHFPVPWQELDTREKPLYSLGGLGNPASAPRSSYGAW